MLSQRLADQPVQMALLVAGRAAGRGGRRVGAIDETARRVPHLDQTDDGLAGPRAQLAWRETHRRTRGRAFEGADRARDQVHTEAPAPVVDDQLTGAPL